MSDIDTPISFSFFVASFILTSFVSGIKIFDFFDSAFSMIPNETDQSFTASSNGNYAVIVSENNCVDTSACETVINVAIHESNSEITVYPNPTSDQVLIQIDGYSGPVELKLYDLSGKLLEINYGRTLHLKNYSRGVYIISILYGDLTKELRIIRQ